MITQTKVLKFGKDAWKKPIVYRLVKDFNLTFSILKAKVLPRQEALMVLELSGEKADFEGGLSYLVESGVSVAAIEQEIVHDPDICIQCGACSGFCPTNALHISNRETMEIGFASERCIGCELCLSACPSRALRLQEGMF